MGYEDSFQIKVHRNGSDHTLHVHPFSLDEGERYRVQIETPEIMNQYPSVTVVVENGVAVCTDKTVQRLSPGFPAAIAKLVGDEIEKRKNGSV